MSSAVGSDSDSDPGSGLGALVERARALDKRAIAGLVAVFEDTRPGAGARRGQAADLFSGGGGAADGFVVGVTGAPGVGKSSLVARMVPELLGLDPEVTVAVVAVDPSSRASGGALLGDRTRIRSTPGERRTYFRSQASAAELGGLGPATFQVCRLLTWLFDVVVVETVGVGQSEIDVAHLADHVLGVVQPHVGDEIQYLKAGLIEIPDSFVLNKCDDPAAEQSLRQLRASLPLARPFDDDTIDIICTSAQTGEGISQLAAMVLGLVEHRTRQPAAEQAAERAAQREVYFLQRWVREEWGRTGLRCTEAAGDLAALYASCGGFDRAQQRLDELITACIVRGGR